nr:hypothetical protein Iba_chr13dCG4820 [Ipomoea batatas]
MGKSASSSSSSVSLLAEQSKPLVLLPKAFLELSNFLFATIISALDPLLNSLELPIPCVTFNLPSRDPYHTGKQAGFLNGDKSTRSSSDQSGIPRLAKSPETERRGEKNSRKE